MNSIFNNRNCPIMADQTAPKRSSRIAKKCNVKADTPDPFPNPLSSMGLAPGAQDAFMDACGDLSEPFDFSGCCSDMVPSS
tara:strand:- start:698 stop:940 length:243 start_codon:yes stop_codon:yes gene_type:complete